MGDLVPFRRRSTTTATPARAGATPAITAGATTSTATAPAPIGPRLGCRRAIPAAVWYERGCAIEASDAAAARHAYARAVAIDPCLADAHNNLARLWHEAGDVRVAEAHYRLALCAAPTVALYWFNLGIAVEDQGRVAEAIACYQAAVDSGRDRGRGELGVADAHFNLARLLERAGDLDSMRGAVRHLAAYRALRKAI